MKYLKYFLILLFIPFTVLAEECDISKITITSMEQSNIEGNTEEIEGPTFQGRSINLNLKMYEVGDSITYNMTINNDSGEDYMIDEDTFKTDSDYIEYTLRTNDNINVVKAGSTKEVSLIVTYKKEVDDNLLTNNKFDASNNLKLSLNTSEKEQPLDIITTDNIKESVDPKQVKNPITSVSSMLLISFILLTSIVIAYILIKRKTKYTKYLLILLSMILIPTVYAMCKCDIEVESTIEIEYVPSFFDDLVALSKEDNSCISKFDGEVTDDVGNTVQATRVYFDKCSDKRNIIFGGFCWQIIRTTETRGIKLLYNGEPVDGKCTKTRGKHLGIEETSDSRITELNEEYLYGTSFTYDTSNNSFTIVDTNKLTWSDSTYESIIGKYTCKTMSNTCSKLYYINSYYSSNKAYASPYIIKDTYYFQIGESDYNPNAHSPAMVGYMFNKVYNTKNINVGTTEYKYGNSFIYDSSTNMYTLSGQTQTTNELKYNEDKLDNTHYTCWNTNGVCDTISYIINIESDKTISYLELKEGRNIKDLINEMLNDDKVNKYNSSAKSIIDAWYKHNMLNYTDKIADVVYCNNRNIISWGTFNPNGGSLYFGGTEHGLYFDNWDNNIVCPNDTDQFAVKNSKAKLTYPVGLMSNVELVLLNNDSLLATGSWYSGHNPYFTSSVYFFRNNASVDYRVYDGEGFSDPVSERYAIRPAITLKKIMVSSGTGSESDPWIVE